MNWKQKTIVIIGTLIMCAMTLYPPWLHRVVYPKELYEQSGYGPLIAILPEVPDTFHFKGRTSFNNSVYSADVVDLNKLGLQIFIIMALTIAGVCITSSRKSERERIASKSEAELK